MPFLHKQLLNSGQSNWNFALSGDPAFATTPVAVGSYSANLLSPGPGAASNSYVTYTQTITYTYPGIWSQNLITAEWWQYVPDPGTGINPGQGTVIDIGPGLIRATILGGVTASGGTPVYSMDFLVRGWSSSTLIPFSRFAVGQWYNIIVKCTATTATISIQNIGTLTHTFSPSLSPPVQWYGLTVNYESVYGSAEVYVDQIRVSNNSQSGTLGVPTQFTANSNTYFLANFEGEWNSSTSSLPTG